jgi:PucR C-terminal helix-turn-helix domain/GGDEF-like domain
VSSAELQALVENLADELDAPAVIEDDELQVVAYSSHDVPVDDIRRESILGRHAPPAAAEWFRRYGLDTAERPLRIPTDRKRGILGRLCVPIRHRGRLVGYLWLIDDEERLGETQIGSAVRTAEQAGLLMFDGLLAESPASGALARLLSPSEELRADGARYIESSGLLGRPGPIVAVVVQPAVAPTAEAQPSIAESLRGTIRRQPFGHVIGRANANHGVLVTRDRRRSDAADFELAAAARQDLLRRLTRDDPCASVVAGIGDPANALADARQSYRQAMLAARVAATITATGPVARWRDLGVFRALVHLPRDEKAIPSLDPRLVRLLEQADSPVVATVETYLDLAGDIKASAERLHLHRGTLYYRLQKAEQVAGINLRSGHDRLSIHLGFKIARLAGLYPTRGR